MRSWGDENVDWKGINDAAEFIGEGLRKYARVGNYSKEKWGTVRVGVTFGWYGIYSIWRPSHHWYPKWWPMRLDFWIANTKAWGLFNRFVISLQQKVYVWRYQKAVAKWPHLYKEIVSQADYGELFEGKIPGYKHSDYWVTFGATK